MATPGGPQGEVTGSRPSLGAGSQDAVVSGTRHPGVHRFGPERCRLCSTPRIPLRLVGTATDNRPGQKRGAYRMPPSTAEGSLHWSNRQELSAMPVLDVSSLVHWTQVHIALITTAFCSSMLTHELCYGHTLLFVLIHVVLFGSFLSERSERS